MIHMGVTLARARQVKDEGLISIIQVCIFGKIAQGMTWASIITNMVTGMSSVPTRPPESLDQIQVRKKIRSLIMKKLEKDLMGPIILVARLMDVKVDMKDGKNHPRVLRVCVKVVKDDTQMDQMNRIASKSTQTQNAMKVPL